MLQIRDQLTRVYGLAGEIIDLRAQLADLKRRVDPMKSKPLQVEAQALDEKLGWLQDKLINLNVRANEDSFLKNGWCGWQPRHTGDGRGGRRGRNSNGSVYRTVGENEGRS